MRETPDGPPALRRWQLAGFNPAGCPAGPPEKFPQTTLTGFACS